MPDPPRPDSGTAPDPDGAPGQLVRVQAALDSAVSRLRTAEESNRALHLLHDEVVQRLFATGMGLQSVADGESDPVLAQRLRGYIADLDMTIDQLRARVLRARPVATDPVTAHRRSSEQ